MEKLIMVKYGELTTKKANRKMFVNLLGTNIKKLLSDYEYTMKKDRVRMYIESDSIDEIAEKLKKVFGIHGIVICYKTKNTVEAIEELTLKLIEDSNRTFKVITKRATKEFPISSMDFSSQMGGFILRNSNLKVDVHNPEIIFHIEIRIEGTFIYLNEEPGLGGYPVGVQGKGMLMLSGGIDSPVAGYLALKRGVQLEGLYFESPPHTSVEAKNKVIKLASIINEYSGSIKLNVINFTKIQESIYKNCDEEYIITIMRRIMYRIAERLALKHKCKVIVNGESIGQVASQTLNSMVVINEVTNMPIIRPVSCFDKLEIINLATKINTYDTSILPFEDCCTIFLPRHPVINPTLKKALREETKFDFETLIDEAIETVQVITNFKDNEFNDLL